MIKRRIALTFSLLILVAAYALGQTPAPGQKAPEARREWISTVDSAKDGEELGKAIREVGKSNEVTIIAPNEKAMSDKEAAEAKKQIVALGNRVEYSDGPSAKDADSSLKKASKDIVDNGADARYASTWLKDALDRIPKYKPKFETRQTPTGGIKSPSFGNVPSIIFWTILVSIVVAGVYLLVKYERAQARARRKATAILDEDEPERSLDEWLEQADLLERQGKYREAVRALYLACLLKVDEAGVARFIRTQTNWEHLSRIESSPTCPPELNLRQATKDFDQIWYGFNTQGAPDVQEFRGYYTNVLEILKRPAA